MSDPGLTKHIFFWRRRKIEIGCVVFREVSRTPGSIGGGAYIVSEGVDYPPYKRKEDRKNHNEERAKATNKTTVALDSTTNITEENHDLPPYTIRVKTFNSFTNFLIMPIHELLSPGHAEQ